ncbi:hypothetical protein JY651_32175 [Pyxidicoccus parkwayensis]|uniref:Secreted protein n=1 Tax=Pyxidicoccus parkwayensis TaxID=2813578 RepID=A0ABX7NR95_9BACT|nr:hypothetical protein [Pyxidicoccus parkwaysis]QSQ19921.1 hypothetical protein JY651_32175 [Pyxidicoccus parkwaysis]
MLLTRRRIAGVVLALALAGALSTGVASGLDRVRGKTRKRPEPPPPFSQRDKARTRMDAEARDDLGSSRRDAPALAAGFVPDASASARSEKGAALSATKPRHATAWKGKVSIAVMPTDAGLAEDHVEAHARDASLSGLTVRIPAPMRVGWTVVESSAGRVRLVAEVERRMGFGAPVSVRISLPRDAALLEGPTDFIVPEGPGGDVRSVAYVFAFGTGAPPVEDLILVAHAEGASFGAHAEERYSFGRVPRVAQRPVPEGPELSPALMNGTGEPLP